MASKIEPLLIFNPLFNEYANQCSKDSRLQRTRPHCPYPGFVAEITGAALDASSISYEIYNETSPQDQNELIATVSAVVDRAACSTAWISQPYINHSIPNVQYTVPLMCEQVCALYSSQPAYEMFSFLAVYNPVVWMSATISLLLCRLMIAIHSKVKTVFNSNRTTHISTNDDRHWNPHQAFQLTKYQISACTALLTMLFSLYENLLLANLLIVKRPDVYPDMESIIGGIDNGRVQLIVDKGSMLLQPTLNLLYPMTTPDHVNMIKHHILMRNQTDALELVTSSNDDGTQYIFIDYQYSAMHQSYKHGQVSVTCLEAYGRQCWHMVCNKHAYHGHNLKHLIDANIKQIDHHLQGLVVRYERFYRLRREQNENEFGRSANQRPIVFNQTKGIIILLQAGLVTSLLIFLGECVTERGSKRNKQVMVLD